MAKTHDHVPAKRHGPYLSQRDAVAGDMILAPGLYDKIIDSHGLCMLLSRLYGNAVWLSTVTDDATSDDLFTLTLGEIQPAVTESVRNSLYLRMDLQTWRIVGIEIPELSLRLNDDPGLLAHTTAGAPGFTVPVRYPRL